MENVVKEETEKVVEREEEDEKEDVKVDPSSASSYSFSKTGKSQENETEKVPKAKKAVTSEDDSRFACNICLDTVKDAVVTVCGHLYCWPCLYRWLNIGHTTCPVCKAGVTKDNVIPLYLQGGNNEDPRLKQTSESVPNRPSAQRPTPQPATHGAQFPGMHFAGAGGGGIAFSAGLGFFPSLFGLQFQNFAPPAGAQGDGGNRALTPEEIQQNFVSQCLLLLGIFVLFCLLLV